MTTLVLKSNKTVEDYSKEMQIFLTDLKKDFEESVKDGILYKLSKMDGEPERIYNFLKNEGYKMTYKDFTTFYDDSLELIGKNGNAINNMMKETYETELTEDDLTDVVGGKLKLWQKVAMGAGVGLAVVGLAVMTGGVSLLVTAAVGGEILVTATATAGAGVAVATIAGGAAGVVAGAATTVVAANG